MTEAPPAAAAAPAFAVDTTAAMQAMAGCGMVMPTPTPVAGGAAPLGAPASTTPLPGVQLPGAGAQGVVLPGAANAPNAGQSAMNEQSIAAALQMGMLDPRSLLVSYGRVHSTDPIAGPSPVIADAQNPHYNGLFSGNISLERTAIVNPNTIAQTATIRVTSAPLQAGQTGPLEFQILDEAGRPIDSYDFVHNSQMHIFSAQSAAPGAPLQDFQHQHPEYLGNGTWRLPSYTPHSGGQTHIVANFVSGLRNTMATASYDVAAPAGPVPAPRDLSGGYTARVIGTQMNPDGRVKFGIEIRDANGQPLQQLTSMFGASAHLIMLDPAAAAAGQTIGLGHGHSNDQIRSGLIAIDAGSVRPGQYQSWLQFNGADGKPKSVPITVDVPNIGVL